MGDLLVQVVSGIEQSFEIVSNTSSHIWIPVALLTLAAYAALRILLSLTTILLRNDGKRRSLSVKPVTKDGDAVFLNAETRDAIFGKGVRPEAVIVKGNGKKLRAEFRTRRGDVLANDCIEVTSSVLDGLFPEDRRFDEAWPQQRDISIRAYGTHGFEGYWLAADKRQRFQNQFAVYLGVLLLAVQLVIDFGLK